jgi:uncharacterized membrane protein
MSPETLAWVKAGHLIGVFLWISGMVAVYWFLRLHFHAPKDAHEKLTLMERSLAMMMDIAAALAIGLGLLMVFGQDPIFLKSPSEYQSRGWFHIKLTVVVLGLLSMHGMLRVRIKKFGMGQISPVPQWQWTVILASVIAIFILVTRVRYEMELKPPAKPAVTAPTTK